MRLVERALLDDAVEVRTALEPEQFMGRISDKSERHLLEQIVVGEEIGGTLGEQLLSAGSSPSRSPVSSRTTHSGISTVLALEAQIRSVKCQLPVLSTAAHVGTTVTLRRLS